MSIRSTNQAGNWGIYISAMLGFLSMFYVSIIGQLYIAEFFLVFIFFAYLVKNKKIVIPKTLKRLIVLGLIWLTMQIVTDLVNGIPSTDFLRGWASISILILDIVGLFFVIRFQFNRLLGFMWGYALGDLLSLFIQPSRFFVAEPWKFGFAGPVLLIIFLLIIQISFKKLAYMKYSIPFLIILAGMSLYLNSRLNAGLILLTAGAIGLRFSSFGQWLSKLRFGALNTVILLLFLISSAYGVLKVYQYTVEQGFLGEDAKLKYSLQYNPKFGVLGVILGGRSTIYGAIQAISDSPFWGYGSWAKDPQYRLYVYEMQELGFALRGNIEAMQYKSDLIPAHSHFFQSWIWAGPSGAVFWLYIAFIILGSLQRSYQRLDALFPLKIFVFIAALWNILFSPFGSGMRMVWAYTLVMGLIVVSLSRNSENNETDE